MPVAHRSLFRLLLAGFAVGGMALATRAQLNNGSLWPVPKLTSIFPAGGKVGSTVEVAFLGADVDAPTSLWFSHPGLKGTPIVPPPPTPDPKKPNEKKAPPPITKINVTIDKSVPPGQYDVRLVNAKGISNPRVFVVGERTEVMEKEPNNDVDQPQKIEVGSTINGVISSPTDVEYFQFAAKKGQRFLFHVAGPSIDSRLTAELRVFDLNNRQLAYARALPNEDAMLDFTAPADGDFLLRLNQFTYTAGNNDYFYRLNVSTGPWVDAVFPPIVEAGKGAQITVYGRGLPGGQPDPNAVVDGVKLDKLAVTVNAPADGSRLDFFGVINPWQGPLSGFEYRLGNSNTKLIAFAQAPVVLENDDNNTMDKAQQVAVPCEIAGRVDKLRDRDWYSFDAKKGDVFVIEAHSHRLDAPTDLYFKLMNVAKKSEITLQDDNPETLNPRGYYSLTRDPSAYRFTVPEDGKYHLMVGSHSADIVAGPSHVYRVRISPEKPDFRLIVMPAEDYRSDACVLGRGGSQYYNVYPVRQDGFKGDITLTMEGLPAGVTCAPQILGGNAKHGLLVVTAGDSAPESFEGPVKVIGTAIVNGQKVVREARYASVTWGTNTPQQNTPGISRHDRNLMLAIRQKAPLRVAAEKSKYVIQAGDKLEIPMKLTRLDPDFKGNFQLAPTPSELPTNLNFAAVTFAPGKDDQKLAITTQPTVPPGVYSLVFRGFAPITPPYGDKAKAKPVNTILPSTPVELVIVPKQVATLSVDNANPSLKAGGEAIVLVKVARQFDFAEGFKVQLMPENANGVTATDLTIGPGQNEGKMTLKIPENGAVGQRQNLTIRAVAVVHGITLNHDVKIGVNVKSEPKKK